jgi:hypothetical protein
MPVVKIDALTNLAAALATAVPALVAKTPITIQQAPSAVMEAFPNCAIIIPGKLLFDPAQRLMQQDLGNNVVVFNVGAHEGPIQIRITTNTTLERAQLEQAVMDLFMGSAGTTAARPGVLPIEIVSTDLVDWVAAFEYEDSMWNDTRAQEREYESVITVNAVIPALTVQSSVYDIDTLKLGFTEDFTTVSTPDNFGPPFAEVVQINQDGSITPVT